MEENFISIQMFERIKNYREDVKTIIEVLNNALLESDFAGDNGALVFTLGEPYNGNYRIGYIMKREPDMVVAFFGIDLKTSENKPKIIFEPYGFFYDTKESSCNHLYLEEVVKKNSQKEQIQVLKDFLNRVYQHYMNIISGKTKIEK